MHVYNTLGRALQEFEPRIPGEVSMYVCGPTVQSAPHLGHGRQAVAFDVIRRYLTWRGFRVTYVSNITDIEDKIINAAAEQGITAEEVARRATSQFLDAYARLRVLPSDDLVYATSRIPAMIEMVTRLIERSHAYPAGGSVYFSVRSLPGYGKLSGRNVDDMIAGARIEPGEHKRDPLDFALWKASKPGEPTWDSPWGPGRPGWHIECSAMAVERFGFGFDIHGGGLDLVFPHHENEIAQAEGAEGSEPFARYWLHNGMLNLRGEKMSKSEGNVVGLLDVLDRHRSEAVRLYYLRAQYRQPLEFAEDLLVDAGASLDRLWAFRRRLGETEAAPDADVVAAFRSAMDEDFNTAEAMAVLFDAVREGNRLLDAGEDAEPMAAAYDVIATVLAVEERASDLGDLVDPLTALAAEMGATGTSPEVIIADLIGLRAAAREARDFAMSDRIRDELAGLGLVLEDGPDGTTWHRR
jgi:cysteinyl-tRNA synthetase